MNVDIAKNLQAKLGEAWLQALREWVGNARLRWGGRLILATLWIWLSLLAQDQAAAWRVQSDEAQAQVQRLSSLRSESGWPQRAQDARLQLESARALLWTAASQGQAEAALQDRLREMAAKAGVTIRELSIAAGDGKPTGGGARPLRVRLNVDMSNRVALTGFLSEISQSPQLMIVDSLRLRPQAAPPRAELEVRVLYREAKAS
ncbi:MAG: GspMb/PilO family protein [Roseateles sp.]|uniref:GspMb/PilO family protein n=1 Tax=Roseateles sp. TaxID=1971397 RepID=UPI004036B9E1